jgi:hypothetical protein
MASHGGEHTLWWLSIECRYERPVLPPTIGALTGGWSCHL